MVDVVVGRIGRPHGLRGEVTVQVTTDDPDSRFAAGAVLGTDPATRGPLIVTGMRRSGPVLVLGAEDRHWMRLAAAIFGALAITSAMLWWIMHP